MPRGNASTTTTTTTKKDILRSSSGAHDGNGSLKTESVDAPTKGTLAKDFLEFWAEFPKKKAKQTAQKAYAKARRTVSHEVIMGGLSRAKPGWSEHQFIPYPATWLNGGSWDDEATPQAGNNWKRAIL
jgi:hypothetical protein